MGPSNSSMLTVSFSFYNRNNIHIQQFSKRILYIALTVFTGCYICCKQDLGNHTIILPQKLVIHKHQFTLTNRSNRLFFCFCGALFRCQVCPYLHQPRRKKQAPPQDRNYANRLNTLQSSSVLLKFSFPFS